MIRSLGQIPRTYRNFNRYREIIGTLIKHGFGDLVSRTNLWKFYYRLKQKRVGKKIHRLSHWERLRMVLEELGPTFVKFGQIMSNRPDILPPALIKELIKLQDSVLPFDGEKAIKMINQELNCDCDKLFKKINHTAIASASIAQVHEAILQNGERVAIKVQRPGIRKIIEIDLDIIKHLSQVAERNFPEIKSIDLLSVVEEFGITIRKEIDFNLEASYIDRFRRNFKNDKRIVVPKVYKELSTKKILTLEFIDGINVNQLENLREKGYSTKEIAKLGTKLVLEQIFKHGFFHADPHPGNVFILPKQVICFLDFGMMGFLLPKYKEYLVDFIIAFANRDAEGVAKILLDFSKNEEKIDIESFEGRIAEMIDQFTYLPIKEIDMKEVINKAMSLVVGYRLRMPPALYLLVKAIITMEGVARELDPDFDMIEHIKPFAKKLLTERMKPKRLLRTAAMSLNEMARLLRDLPYDAREIIKQVKTGKARIVFEHQGLEPMLNTHDRISNRVSFSIIIGAMIIGSSLIVHSGVPPLWNDVPIIGIAGFTIASIMGFWLIISIMNTRKL